MYLGVVYYKTRNILGLVIFHGMFDATISINHFFGETPVLLINVCMFVAGMACLGYLAYGYSAGYRGDQDFFQEGDLMDRYLQTTAKMTITSTSAVRIITQIGTTGRIGAVGSPVMANTDSPGVRAV